MDAYIKQLKDQIYEMDDQQIQDLLRKKAQEWKDLVGQDSLAQTKVRDQQDQVIS